MHRRLALTTAALPALAGFALTVHAYAMGSYVPFMLGTTAMTVGAGAWLVASSHPD